MKKGIYLVVAIDPKGGMGKDGKLPWHIKEDLAFFQRITTKTDDANLRNMVVMGSTTWNSIPEKSRPLAGRRNVVLTRDKNKKFAGAEVAHSIEEAIALADDRTDRIMVIGGAKVFDQIMKKRLYEGIYLTRIRKEYKCDTYFPKMPPNLKAEKLSEGEEDGVKYEFLLYRKK